MASETNSILPSLNGKTLTRLQVSERPVRYVYGPSDVIDWLREELLGRDSKGMPSTDLPNWI